MSRPTFIKILISLVFLSALGIMGGNAQVVFLPPGPKTPTNLEVRVNFLDIGTDPLVPTFNIFDVPKTIDVITDNGIPGFFEFGNGAFRKDNYRVIKIGMMGTGEYRGFNPCDGSEVSTKEPIYFPDGIPGPADPGIKELVIDYNAPVPGTDLRPGAILISRFTVRSTKMEIRLVFFATESVICASSQKPARFIQGLNDFLKTPVGVSLDIAGQRIFISNDATDQIVAYTKALDPKNPTTFPLLFIIQGSNTELDRPGGIFYDSDNDEVAVVSSGERESLAVFRTDVVVPNPYPKSIIKGTNTGLNEPSAVFVDLPNQEFIVANIGSNSLTFYNRNDLGDVRPKRSIVGFSTGISEPSGVLDWFDGINDWIVVSNSAKDTIGFFDRALVIGETDSKMLETYDFGPDILLSGPKTRLNRPEGIFVDDTSYYTGTASVTTLNSIILATLDFTPDEFFYNRVYLTSGNLAGESRLITGNTGDTLFVSPPWSDIPDSNSQFEIRGDNLFVANHDDDRVLIFSLQEIRDNTVHVHPPDPGPDTHISETAPIFTLKGKDTKIRLPRQLAVDPLSGEIFVVNNSSVLDPEPDSVVLLTRRNRTVQMEKLPHLVNSGTQQFFFPRYYFSGELNDLGSPVRIDPMDPFSDPADPIRDGYDMSWQVTDDRLRQEKDVSEAKLLPPSGNVFTLADGSLAGYLDFGCTQFEPFIRVRLFTNCDPLPLSFLPFPLPTAIYEIPAVVLGSTVSNKINFLATPRDSANFPVPLPNIILSGTGPGRVVDRIEWYYKGEENPLVVPYPPLMIFSQDLIIELKDRVDLLNPCFMPLGGGTGTIVFAKQDLDPLVRSVLEVKNNNCEIRYEDVRFFQLTARDALENHFIYKWTPVLP